MRIPSTLRNGIALQLLLLSVLSFAPFVSACARHSEKVESQYKHKTEAEIAAMTPAQRVDEYANEQAFHKYDLLDRQSDLIYEYIIRGGAKGIPRIIEVIDEYNPSTAEGKASHKGERFDAMWMLLGALDDHLSRLRASPEGRQAIDALARAIDRMRAAGYGKKDQHEWDEHGRYDSAVDVLKDAKGTNATDEAIQDTLTVKYKIRISDGQLLAFSNFLIARDPNYPSWSDVEEFTDFSRKNEAGNPAQVLMVKNAEPFYVAYQEFKKRNGR